RVIERGRLGDVADAPLDFERLRHDVEARHDRPAVPGSQHAGEDPDGGRLAGAVRSEEPENLAGLDAKIQIVYRGLALVALRQVLGDDHWAPATVIRIARMVRIP